MNIMEIEPDDNNRMLYKGWKISLAFIGLNQNVQRLISSFVLDNLNITDDVM
jgi:hypothetical protein